ncbi:MAG: Cobalt-zinc-cadmium resistance protein CzcD [uncultured Nocardioidaceae bacterium]|uniref:Cobalt-zinc-cadmium resistance protein CzcD n=1 Tax=uncultured Nocardioidaceae bacterium TaxID=253824 RepID=A0A6J4NJT1_9ACTN|nr:MAG: Cobalt-zinc-cadmium resistance protein CzcD [uncultured Nocardioidaceae bacterium]
MGSAHGAGHGHGHAAGRAVDRSRLRAALTITVTVLVVELVGAWWSGSLALLADAGHMATDAGAVLLALAASYMASRPPSTRRTFGWHRAEVLAALANAVVLLVVCVYLLVEGVRRLLDPPEVEAGPMVVFAVVGLLANGVSLALLSGRRESSLNMRGAYLEVLGDLIGSVAVVAAGLVVLATGFLRADAIATLLIALVIVPRALVLAKEALEVLLEATPSHIEPDEIRDHLLGMDGVVDVHDLHVWTITSGLPSLSVHVTVEDRTLEQVGVGALLDRFSDCVAAHFEVDHATFQVEPASHREHEHLGEAHP